MWGLFKFVTASFSDIVNAFLVGIFNIIGNLTVIFAKALDYAIFVRPGANLIIVEETWKILRDFTNMFFIILLVYMAFSVIFDYGGYKFDKMIVRFIIVAVLINFSLVIGNLIIDASQVLSNIFLGMIGNLSDRLGTYLNPSLLLPGVDSTTGALLDGSGVNLISLVFAIILGAIFMFSLLVAMVFAIIRVPFIWALLIVSPLAWMAYITPNGEKWWKDWWGYFIGWNLFLPVYLFFMYLGLLFLSQRDKIIGAVVQSNITAGAANPANAPLLEGLSNSLSFNLVFFYIFTAIIMVGGTWAAKSVTSMAGTGFEKGLDWAKNTIKGAPGYSSYFAGQKAAESRFGQFQKEGFKNPYLNKIYGGENVHKRIEARMADRFGVGEGTAEEKQEAAEIGTIKSRIRNVNTNELQNRINTGTRAQKLAVRELLKERNQLSGAEIIETYKMYGHDSTENGRKFIGSVDFGKLSARERGTILDKSTDPQTKQKIAVVMAEKGNMGANHANWLVEKSKELYTQGSEMIDFIQKAEKEDFMATIEAKSILATEGIIEIKAGGVPVTTPNAILNARVQKMKADALSEVDNGSWGNVDFFNAVQTKATALQGAQPPVAGSAGPPVVAPKPGGGDIFKANMLKEVTDNTKLGIINHITP